MAPKVVLTYFGVRARAELIRLILKAGGVDFEDNRLTQEEWPALKQGTPFHSLPVLSWDGEEVGQSVTIARFCAKKTGLAGKDDLEQARADAIVDQVIDCFAGMIGVIFASDSTSPVPASAPNRSEENKKVKGDDMFGNKFPHFLKVVDRHLKKNGGKWMVGDSMTWADLAVFNLLDNVMNMDNFKDIPGSEMREEVRKEYTDLRDLHHRVKAVPEVAKWIEERPKTPF